MGGVANRGYTDDVGKNTFSQVSVDRLPDISMYLVTGNRYYLRAFA